jgi:hypothetical protein
MRFHDKIDTKFLKELYNDDFEYIADIEMLYNFIPKFIIMSIALTLGKKLRLIGDNAEEQKIRTIWNIWEENNMQVLKYKLARNYFLHGVIDIEAVLENNNQIKILLHEPGSVRIEKIGEQIIKAEISSESFVDGKKIKSEKIITPEKIIIKTDGKEESKENLYDGVPFIHLENTNYRVKSLIRYQDRMNLYEYYLDALFDLHADPILYDDLGESYQKNNKETYVKISQDKRKIRKFLHYPKDSKGVSLLESNGAMVQRIQEQQNNIFAKIQKLYPELVLLDILQSGSGQITGAGLSKKLVEINASVNYARGEIKNALEELNELIGWLTYNTRIKTQVNFEEIFPKTFEDVLTQISLAAGVLSRDWQLERLEEEGIINSAKEEKERTVAEEPQMPW